MCARSGANWASAMPSREACGAWASTCGSPPSWLKPNRATTSGPIASTAGSRSSLTCRTGWPRKSPALCNPSIRRAEIERARSKRPETLAAYDLVMRAFPHLWAHSATDNPIAIGLLRTALELDPAYGLAAALAAWAHGPAGCLQLVPRYRGRACRGSATHPDRDGDGGGRSDRSHRACFGHHAARWRRATGDGAYAESPEARSQPRLGVDASRIRPRIYRRSRRGPALVRAVRPPVHRSTRSASMFMSAWDLPISAPDARRTAIRFAQKALAERPGITWPYRDLAVYFAHQGETAAARDAPAPLYRSKAGKHSRVDRQCAPVHGALAPQSLSVGPADGRPRLRQASKVLNPILARTSPARAR